MFLLLALEVLAASTRSPDTRNGWKDATWASSIPEIAQCHADGDTSTCTLGPRAADRVVGDIQVDSVTYTYFQERLVVVTLATAKKDVTELLGAALAKAYGVPKNPAPDGSCTWTGSRVKIVWMPEPKMAGGTLTYSYVPLLADMQEGAAAETDPEVIEALASEL